MDNAFSKKKRIGKIINKPNKETSIVKNGSQDYKKVIYLLITLMQKYEINLKTGKMYLNCT